jgi:hypothetical protein
MEKLVAWEEPGEVYSGALNFPNREETFEIIGICMEVHRIFGKGLLEIVY